jgi:hypothetical protein
MSCDLTRRIEGSPAVILRTQTEMGPLEGKRETDNADPTVWAGCQDADRSVGSRMPGDTITLRDLNTEPLLTCVEKGRTCQDDVAPAGL